MNQIILMGRLTREPSYKTSGSGVPYANYGIAVDRLGKDKGVDFFEVVTYQKNADFASMYLHKGTKILISGELHHEEYTGKDGEKKHSYTITANRQEFCERRSDAGQEPDRTAPEKDAADGFLDLPKDAANDEGLPWA